MLVDLALGNLGVIDSAATELSAGLTVLTGETGAGKTMVVEGLRLVTGGRADAGRIRTGADQATVEAHLSLAGVRPSEIVARAEELAAEAGCTTDENGEWILSRTVNLSGRSRAHITGRSVPASSLKALTAELITIHGQNDQLRLTSADAQRSAVDQSDPTIAPLFLRYDKAFKTFEQLAKQLHDRTRRRRELAQETDRLLYAIDEIDRVDPKPGEEDEIKEQVKRLQDLDSLRVAAATALAALDGSDAAGGDWDSGEETSSASELVGQAEQTTASASDPCLQEISTTLAEARILLKEASGALGGYLSSLPADPGALDGLLTRQQELKSLTRKYAPDSAGVLQWRDKARRKLASIDSSSEAIEKLTEDTLAAEKDVAVLGAALHKARKKAAERLSVAVTEELAGLLMPKARFEVSVTAVDTPHAFGIDTVTFLFATAPGETLKPVATTASGGELSRLMLALEVILAGEVAGTTLVFDEVDAGVGGRAAVEIGRRLARLAQTNQVIVVTHLPQVAAFADSHLHVSKAMTSERGGRMESTVRSLSENERVEELSRMLAGLDGTDTGRAHARELLDTARAAKEELSATS